MDAASEQVLEPGAQRYLELLKLTLTRSLFGDVLIPVPPPGGVLRRPVSDLLWRVLRARGYEVATRVRMDRAGREQGADLPVDAETMIGLRRMDNLQDCAVDVIRRGVPGDFIETGVWRGGATIFLRGVLAALDDPDRVVWVADSFAGLPAPDVTRYPQDRGDDHWTRPELAVSLDEVKANFARYGLLDERVTFVVGWFSESLAAAPIKRLALLRLDGDMYGSTMDALEALYPKLSEGGYVIIDDYGAIPTCRAAVDDFRAREGITEPITPIDWTGVYWRVGGP